jgi:hypothetical protein
MTRSPAKTDMVGALGARPVVADALDPDAVARAVADTAQQPHVVAVAPEGGHDQRVQPDPAPAGGLGLGLAGVAVPEVATLLATSLP